MPSTWKTFAANEVLTAADVNNALNPSTAPHLPRAVATGNVSAGAPAGSYGTFTITFPSGRFSSPPVLSAILRGTSPALGQMVAVVVSTSSSAASMRLYNNSTTTFASGIPVDWVAIQN